MDSVHKKHKKPQQGKGKRIKRTEQLLKRQRDKTWLETHIWHAKRMKMESIWGYRLAIEPTEKSFRPSHRASVHGSILHDASYFALIELKGPEDIIRAVLDSCCDCQGPSVGAKRSLSGARACDTHIYRYGTYPFNLIAPATVLWRPTCPFNEDPVGWLFQKPSDAAQPASEEATSKRKRKGKKKASDQNVDSKWPPNRTVWIRVHPAVTSEVHVALRTAASFALDTLGKITGRPECKVDIADLRGGVNVFEIMGPKSSQVIKGALKPVQHKWRGDFNKFWQALDQVQTTGSLPRGMVIGFTVQDPRLDFPPKNTKVDLQSEGPSISSTPVFPTAALAQSEIWEDSVRNKLHKPVYKKKDIDQRRSQNLVPGTKLQPTAKDNTIPVLLIQRSIESASSSTVSSSTHTSGSPSLHGWTLVIPAGWAMTFLSSLTHTGTRVGGQRERQTQAFEGGCANFPRDYPCTDAYNEHADVREEMEESAWERKPPAKRVNYEKLDTRSPWRADWEVVLGLEDPPSPETDFISAQRETPVPPTEQAAEKKVRPWLLRGAGVPAMLQNLSSMFNPGAGLLDFINQARVKRGLDPLKTGTRTDELWQSALITVRVILCGRGNPEDLAMIYALDDAEAKKWHDAEARRQQGATSLLDEGEDDTQSSTSLPAPKSIIGYVTTGHYSLARGTGHAVGAIPVRQLFELWQQAERLHTGSSWLVKIRDRGDNICRVARIEMLAD